MNWDQVSGKWKQLQGSVKTRWGKLTDDDLDVIAGHKDQLVGRIQERYGIRKEEAELQVNEWNTRLGEENEAERERLNRKVS
ncbi:MAG: CsbD family protein [Acidobacteria bacterium]|nr:CsbD family protein [Acidobacteriota bacterium]MBV9624088.1 CsbD family protein [Acidobacteriota bacterium]